MLDIIGAIVIFLAFLIEFALILAHQPKRKLVRETLANLSLGGFIILFGIIEKGIAFGFFSLVYSIAFFNPSAEWWLWVVAFFACDFMHYVYHWVGHRTRLFWAAHVTHHSSQNFNLSTGWRTNFIHLFYRFLFWSPLCLFGIPPYMILFFESISAIQNFLVHTEKVGKLGILDWLLNTPSNHRVHHGSNPEYIDKNMGGILMIYDHLFGTYAKEETTVVYGITHNIDTENPVKILLHEYASIIKQSSRIRGITRKVKFLFSKPN